MFVKLFAAAFAASLLAGTSFAATVGNWDGSNGGRTFADDAATVAMLEGRGNTVEAAGALTAANLANDDVFVIAEAQRDLSGQEASDLLDWITAGGRLVVTVDSGGTGAAFGNSILAALGSALSFGGSAVNGVLTGGNFATEGGPFDIVGETLNVTPGTAVNVNGGASLGTDYLAYDQIGAGFVFGFGDHFQNAFFNNNVGTVNGQMIVNIVEADGVAPPAVPLPATLPLMVAALGGGLAFARRRKS